MTLKIQLNRLSVLSERWGWVVVIYW